MKRGELALAPSDYRRLYVDERGSLRELARLIGASKTKVRADLQLCGIPVREEGRLHKFVAAPEVYRRLYVDEGLSLQGVSVRLGLPAATVCRHLKKLGIDRRPVSSPTLDNQFFDVIDSDVKAYAFGLICADGSIYTKRWYIRIRLQERDAPILETLSTSMRGGRLSWIEPPRAEWQAQRQLGICSRGMVTALAARGVSDNKQAVLQRVKAPRPEFMRAYVRGLIDGDGHLAGRAGVAPVISFVNHNESLLQHVAAFFKKVTGRQPRITRCRQPGGCWHKSVTENSERAQQIMRALYLEDETAVAIARKRATARRAMRWRRRRPEAKAA